MFEIEQVWFESRDQTRVPMFLVHKRGFERDGGNAAVIHGYGGFGVSLVPKFTAHVIPFLECGGVYAIVNARGGGEFGEEWHRAGMRENKQNVFDDFIAAGEWLIREGTRMPRGSGVLDGAMVAYRSMRSRSSVRIYGRPLSPAQQLPIWRVFIWLTAAGTGSLNTVHPKIQTTSTS